MDIAGKSLAPDTIVDLHVALLSNEAAQPWANTSMSTPLEADAEPGFRRKLPRLRSRALSDSVMETLHPLVRISYFESLLGIRLTDDGEPMQPLVGESGIPQTILAIAKSFVGSGITFLPGAFNQGGWLFSSSVLVAIAFGNAVCIWLLLQCSASTGLLSFGDIAEKAAGSVAKQAVHVSLVISQFGTNVAYLIFISKMAGSLGALMWVTNEQLIVVALAVIIPLCFIRSIHRLEFVILGADVLIVFGLGIALWYAVEGLLVHGPDTSLERFKPTTCGLFMGTAVFTFEGIPFILPIRSSMREPQRFWPLFVKVFTCIVLFFVLFGAVGYAVYGSAVQSVILLSLPQDDVLIPYVRIAYMIALILSSPMVFLPAARITELWIFGVVHEKGAKKWRKNALRSLEIGLLGVVALYGGEYFEKFLAFVGGLCCAPIAFIYPAFFHLRLCACNSRAILVDLLFVYLGVAAMVFVLYQAATS